MKILITNTVALNGGDAAILIAILNLLRTAFGQGTTFIVYDNQPDVASRYYPEITFRKWIYLNATRSSLAEHRIKYKHLHKKLLVSVLRYMNLVRFYFAAWCWSHSLSSFARIFLIEEESQALAEYNSADLIVSTGGTYLVEDYGLETRVFDYNVSLLMQRPLVFFTQSLGPFLKQTNQRKLNKIFNNALLIFLRDELSLSYLRDLNVNDSNVHVSSDAVFSLAEEKVLKNASDRSWPKNSRLKIAISVRYWKHFKSITTMDGMKKFQDALRVLTKHLVQEFNAEIIYLSTCQGVPEYWTNDSKIAMEIVSPLDEDIQKYITVNDEFHSPEDLLKLLKSYDLVIATRMHMAILALASGTPVFPIAYEFKTQELFNRLGLGQWVQNIETIDQESIVKSVDAFFVALPEIRQTLFGKVERERELAMKSSFIVKEAFEQRQNS